MTKRAHDEDSARPRHERPSDQRHHGLHIVSPIEPEVVRPVTADESLRELIAQVQRPTRKKTLLEDDLPPAA